MTGLQIIYPPQVDPSYIPYRAASCTKLLQKPGHTVCLHDDNLLACAYFLDLERLRSIVQEARERLTTLENQDRLAEEQQYVYYRTVKALLYGPSVLAHISQAWEMYRDETQPLAARTRAKRYLQQGLEIASLPFIPTLISLNDLNLRYSTQSTHDLVASTTASSENPYLAFWQPRLSQLQQERPGAVILWIEFDQQLIPAFTLAHLIKQAGLPIRTILTGPFLLPFADTWHGDGPWRTLIDDIALGNEALVALAQQHTEGANTVAPARIAEEDIWTVKGLPLHRYLVHPPTLSLSLDESSAGEAEQTQEQIERLYKLMRILSQEVAGTRFSLASPLRIESLLCLAQLMQNHGYIGEWGSAVSYGSVLTDEIARTLAQMRCRFLHFELKGYLGYADGETARQQMLQTWRRAREAGLSVLWTITYGHPLDDPAQFAAFIDFLTAHLDASDRIVHFKLFRVYRHSRFWQNPDRYGLRILETEDRARDLQRHFPYISRSGVESKQLPASAARYISALRKRAQDFPYPALTADEWAFSGSPQSRQSAEQARAATSQEGQLLVTSPSLEIRHLAYPFAELERSWSGFVAGQTERAASGPLERSPMTLVYDAQRDRFMALNETVCKLLECCREPVKQEAVLARFRESQRPALQKIIHTLIGQQLIVPR